MSRWQEHNTTSQTPLVCTVLSITATRTLAFLHMWGIGRQKTCYAKYTYYPQNISVAYSTLSKRQNKTPEVSKQNHAYLVDFVQRAFSLAIQRSTAISQTFIVINKVLWGINSAKKFWPFGGGLIRVLTYCWLVQLPPSTCPGQRVF